MMHYRSIVAMILGAAAVLTAVPASGRGAITTDEVAAAIRAAGMLVSSQQVSLLTEITASSNMPALKVESIERWGNNAMKVRLSCTGPQECLPFFVAVHGIEANNSRLLMAASDGASAIGGAAKASSGPIVMRSGAPATLFIDGQRIHIRLSVVCLDNGAIGQSIRVTSKDRKNVYTANVVDGTTLRATL